MKPQGKPLSFKINRTHKIKNPESLGDSGLKIFRRRPTLPHSFPCSTIGAEGLNFRVRDGNGCLPFAIATENFRPNDARCRLKYVKISMARILRTLNLDYRHLLTDLCRLFCGQASRPISTGKLNVSPHLHTRPINLVVCKGSSDPHVTMRMGYLILG